MKENQLTLKEDIAQVWGQGALPPPQAIQITKHGGRVEERRLWVSDMLVGYSDWPHLAQVCRQERVVTRKRHTAQEVAYAVTSLPSRRATPQRLLSLWRGHWQIENCLYWVRDMVFDEDRCQVRTGRAPYVLATLRNLTISLLHLAGIRSIAQTLRRHAAYPNEVLCLMAHPPGITE